jgi:hypothetical protein
MRNLLLLSSLLISPNLSADCGLYEVRGVGRLTKNGPVVVVNEKTQSEIILNIPITNEAMLAPYIDRPLVASVNIQKQQNVIEKISSRLPNPIAPQDTGMKLLEKRDCKK